MSRLQHRRGRRSSYVRQLQSDYWQEVCRIVRLRDGHRCQLCGRGYSLEIHHKTYYVDGQSIVGREKEHQQCPVTHCAECHQKQHNHHGQAK